MIKHGPFAQKSKRRVHSWPDPMLALTVRHLVRGISHAGPPKNRWPNTDGARGVLLFAQLLNEMVSSDSFESFRAYSLNSVTRLYETRAVIIDVDQQRMSRVALVPVIDELGWSLRKDPVAHQLAAEEISALAELMKNRDCDLQLLFAHIVLITKLVEPKYKERLQERLIELHAASNRRIRPSPSIRVLLQLLD